MRVIIRSKDVKLWLPVPLRLSAIAVDLLPATALENIRKSVPAPFDELITKENLREIIQECIFVLKQYRGLEIVHVEARDGAYVSVRI